MDNVGFSILLGTLGVLIGFIAASVINYMKAAGSAKKATNLIEQAKKEIEKIKRDAAIEQKEEAHKLKMDLDIEKRRVKRV